MKKFKKYEFIDEDQADQFIEDLGDHDNDIVKLGFLIITPAVYDEDLNQIEPPVFSDKYSVDVIWKSTKDKDWKTKRIKLNGKKNSHTFYGWNYKDSTV